MRRGEDVGNIVTYEARPDIECIQMNHGLTSVFIAVLSLAAWFASHDQGVFGSGMVGFDVSELPWSADTFASDWEFVLRAIDATKARTG